VTRDDQQDQAPDRLGPYELVERLATGGMAEVYLAKRAGPHGFSKLVAVKRILPQLARDPDFVAMFVDEARVCARLCHPNIVQVFDFGEAPVDSPVEDAPPELYMAMEYVDGTTGARLIRAAAARSEDIPLEASLHIALSVLRGLEYAHNAKGEDGKPLELVHRDVSPGNVLLDRSGAVKLTDFGIARAAELERRTEAGQLKGKLGYMSPEQVVGRDLDPRSDLFTVGIVLAEMVTLRPLFSGGRELDVLLRIRDADLGAIDRNAGRVPDDVRHVLYKALAKDPNNRFANASAFADALEEIVRRRRLQVGPSKLSAWIARLGLAPADTIEERSSNAARSAATLSPGPPPSMRDEFPSSPTEPRDVSPQIYRVKLDTGMLGPISYPRLVELFATGAVSTETPISRESGPFLGASHFAELTRFVTSPALRWDEQAAATWREPLERRVLPSKLFRLSLERETGSLVLRDGPKRKKIYFVEGAPEFVASTDKSELLGEHLVARGQVLRMEVDMALAMLPRFGGRLGDALVGLGVLRPVELFRAIHEQTQQRFLEVFSWTKGEMAFFRGARSQEETFPLSVDPYELVARGIREGYDEVDIADILSPFANKPLERVVLPPIRVEAFRFGDRESRVLRRVDGKVTLNLLSKEKIADASDLGRAIFMGLSFELVRMAGW
jgi:serine/threonine-protein kinase